MSWVKPDFVDVSGSPIVEPPFIFREVTTRVFPLKANMSRLTQFCAEYLNMDIPQDIVHYTPALPYVYLMVLNYGSMSSASVTAQNAGWVAQYEVTFTVPLRRWRRENGKLVFKGWASVSPFIYVDDQLSQMTGREVYGWPKVLSKISSDIPLWSTHPRKPTRLFTLGAPLFRNVYAGEEEKISPLIHIDYDPPGTFSEFPVNPWNPWAPLSIVPNAIRNSLSLMEEGLDLLLSQRIRGFPSELDLPALLAMARKGGKYFTDFVPQLLPMLRGQAQPDRSVVDPEWKEKEAKLGLPKFLLDNVTLKQFRDPERPQLACYQALVNSKMGVNRINEAGLLGDPGLLRGDPSGGYTIRLHQYTAHPIIEVLGIEVPGTDEAAEGGPVAILKPTFPIWSDTDLWYGKGELICSRTNYLEGEIGGRSSEDRIKRGRWFYDTDAGTKDAPPDVKEHTPVLTNYNTALGAATQPIVGPFHFPDMHVQVYPLLADREKLIGFVDWYLNKTLEGVNPRQIFKVAGSYVYLIVSVVGNKLGTMWSANNNIGWWAEREVAFCVPVKWYQRGDHSEELISMAMIEPFVYANSGRAVITDREVNGRSSFQADINSPYDVWNSEGPHGNRQVLHMDTELFSAISAGQKATKGTLLEIDEGDVYEPGDAEAWRAVQDGWGSEAAEDLRRKTLLARTQESHVRNAKSLALEILAHQAPVNRISLKQYRDSDDISKACYQAAVHTERSITRIYNIREIERPIHVRITHVPGHPIVEKLGLKVKSVDSRQGHVVENLQPIRPFWMHVAIKEELGRVIGTVVTADTNGGEHVSEKTSDAEAQKDAAAVLGKPLVTKKWVSSHPWLKRESNSSSEALAADPRNEPYFEKPGDTRVGLSLAELANEKHQYLTDLSKNWLRRSLTHEMAWIKLTLHQLLGSKPEDIDKWLKGRKLDESERAAIKDFFKLDQVGDYCSSTSIESLLALSAIVERMDPPLVLQVGAMSKASSSAARAADDFDLLKELKARSRALSDSLVEIGKDERSLNPDDLYYYKKELSELDKDLKRIIADFEKLSAHLQQIANMILTTDIRDRMNRLRDHTKDKSLVTLIRQYSQWDATAKTMFDDPMPEFPGRYNPITEAKSLLHPVRDATQVLGPLLSQATEEGKPGLPNAGDWRKLSEWRRLSRGEARNSIHELNEAQVVLESILSSEWENNGWGMRWKLGDPERPDHSLPVSTIGPDSTNNAWPAEQGLSFWPEKRDDRNIWEFVARKPQKGTKKRKKDA